ncbi:MAG TPA: hypothetical protein VKN14_04500, partial [Flavobacteriaceae bacterium]|nr:hypothetical protein [Flavobacteriaceae bacterium]
MARQKGLMKFSGTIGDLNFYVTKGVGYVRKAGGGFNGEAIRNKPSMQRVRENASEFGHCSTIKKQYRLALQHFLHDYKDPKLHGRMMTLFTKIKDLDTISERGQRHVGHGIKASTGKRLLKHFKFTPTGLLDRLLANSSFSWANQTLSIVKLELKSSLFPKDATHIGLQLGVLD